MKEKRQRVKDRLIKWFYKYFWLTWTFLSTRFGVVKSFCFSFMRFAKKNIGMCIHFIHSQSLSGSGLATQMLLRDRTLPRARGLISGISIWGMLLPWIWMHRSAHITFHCSHWMSSCCFCQICVPQFQVKQREMMQADLKMSCFKVKRSRSQVTKSKWDLFFVLLQTSGSHMFF